MEVIREVRKVINRRVVIDLPDDFNESEVEILILPKNRDSKSVKKEKKKIEKDIIESLEEVKLMRIGKLEEKTAQELLSEL